MTDRIGLAVALEGAGWHPAAWREPDAQPARLTTAAYWTDLVRDAEVAFLDFVTFEDAFSLQDGGKGVVRSRLDAVLIAAAVAPATSGIGLVPSVVATHTEPFHISKAIASLDYASTGRASYQVRISRRGNEFAHIGRRTPLPDGELSAEADDHIEVVRRLWDSWEDDAEIRDAATGRFIDRDKLHYIDFHGRWFDVKGPSITPRPPQGQPPVFAAVEDGLAADVVFATASDEASAAEVAGASTAPVYADLVVFLDVTTRQATDRLNRLNDLAAYEPSTPVFVGTPEDLADHIRGLHAAGISGVRLHPGTLPHDLTAIARDLAPLLRPVDGYAEPTLRARLGLPEAVNRYAKESAS